MPTTKVAEAPPPAAAAPSASALTSSTTATAADDATSSGGANKHKLVHSASSSALRHLELALEAARREARDSRNRVTALALAVLLLLAALVAGWLHSGAGVAAARASLTHHQQKWEAAVRSTMDHSPVLSRLNVTLGDVAQSLRSALGGDDDDDNNAPRVGQALRSRGARPKHPVLVVPGFVTSGLELWEGRNCARSFFRQRLWGTLSMASTLLQNKTCWLDHMSLDPSTGLDPPSIRLRAAQGLQAVDNFLASYWVFSKLFRALGDVGYDNNFVVAAAYDWRLALPALQQRDAYFTRLKSEAELLRATSGGQKIVLVSHSFGGVVTLTFLDWVERAERGWTEKHVHAWANLAAPLLGLPKALAPLVSGESRETADMMQGMAFIVESYLSRTRRARMFRTWGSLQTMLPVGGPKVWGTSEGAPDDPPELKGTGRTLGALLMARDDRSSSAGRLGASATAHLEAVLKRQQERQQARRAKRRSLFASLTGAAAASSGEEEGSEEAGGDNTDNNKTGTSDLLEVPLDVDAALRFVGRMAGPDFVRNMPRFAGAARRLDMDATLRDAEEEAAARAELVREHGGDDDDDEGQQQRQAGGKSSSRGGKGAGSCSASSSRGGTCGASDAGGKKKNKKQPGPKVDDDDDDDNIDVGTSGRTPHGNSTRAAGAAQKAASLELVMRAFNAVLGYGAAGPPSAVGSEGASGDPASADAAAAAAAEVAAGAAPTAATTTTADDPLSAAKPPGPPVRALDSSVTPLPKAPSLRVYCMYGTGVPTERAYHYAREKRGLGRWAIDTSRMDPATSLDDGVQLSDGDGTVPLISNGALCEGGWRTRRLNPGGSRVVVREYENSVVPVWQDARGGPKASSHVELLGHHEVMEDILRIVTGYEEGEVADRYHSRIRDIAKAIPWAEL